MQPALTMGLADRLLALTGQIGAWGWIGGAAVLGASAGVGAAYAPPGFGAGKAS